LLPLADLVARSAAVRDTRARLEKIALLAGLLRQLSPEEVPVAIGFLTGWPRQGRLGIGWATAAEARPPAAVAPTLSLSEVDAGFTALKALRGPGSAGERQRLLGELLGRATAPEQDFLLALLAGEVRQGALDGIMHEAVARAAGVPAGRIRRAAMLAGDLAEVAAAVLTAGETGLAGYALQLFRPVQPMLADSASTVAEAMAELGEAVLEWKLDGARIQVHRREDRVAVYTRNLNEVTAAVPEVVDAVLAFPARELILDGEVIALGPEGRPLPFQDTMRRFGRRLEVAALRAELPLAAFFFDVLLLAGDELLDLPLSDRLARLEPLLPEPHRVPRLVTSRVEDAEAFQADAVRRGHEGIMAKSPSAPYAAGRRGSAWLKVKTARTFDLVVLAAEWGSGRRKGWLSNLHLGARNPDSGEFVMLGKTFKGMTDALLQWQTAELLARETGREGPVVLVRPELVVEVAFNEVQRSSQYPGGVTLRFARVKRYRADKSPAEADTVEAVRALCGPSPRPSSSRVTSIAEEPG
jgi:DNA ligase-1